MVINVTENTKDFVKQCASLPALIETIKKEHKVDKLYASLAFGSDYWDDIYTKSKPQRLKTFAELGKGDVTAPATGGGVFLHIHADRKDMIYVLATEFIKPIKKIFRSSIKSRGFII
ncbi:MAG: putative iron-dependent peroxidase [Gammaproteobacteria bacterium]|jgi:putative iron-dependent peroxidase